MSRLMSWTHVIDLYPLFPLDGPTFSFCQALQDTAVVTCVLDRQTSKSYHCLVDRNLNVLLKIIQQIPEPKPSVFKGGGIPNWLLGISIL